MAVIAKRKRLGVIVGKRLEAAKMRRPLLVAEIQPDPLRPAIVEELRSAVRKLRRFDGIVEVPSKPKDLRIGPGRSHPR